jgi:hypothetical protein
VTQLDAIANDLRNATWQRHRERAADARPSLRIDDDGPRTGAHLSIRLLDDTALDADAKIRTQRLARSDSARSGASNGFVVAERLVRDSGCDGDTRELRLRCQRLEHGAHRVELDRIRRADGDRSDRREERMGLIVSHAD